MRKKISIAYRNSVIDIARKMDENGVSPREIMTYCQIGYQTFYDWRKGGFKPYVDNRPIRQRKQENKRKVLAIWQDNPTLTQVEIAALAGVSPPTVGRYFKEEGIVQKKSSL